MELIPTNAKKSVIVKNPTKIQGSVNFLDGVNILKLNGFLLKKKLHKSKILLPVNTFAIDAFIMKEYKNKALKKKFIQSNDKGILYFCKLVLLLKARAKKQKLNFNELMLTSLNKDILINLFLYSPLSNSYRIVNDQILYISKLDNVDENVNCEMIVFPDLSTLKIFKLAQVMKKISELCHRNTDVNKYAILFLIPSNLLNTDKYIKIFKKLIFKESEFFQYFTFISFYEGELKGWSWPFHEIQSYFVKTFGPR